MEMHKKLLASISPELNKHVNNDMREGIEGRIHLPEDREEVLTLFIEWAYTGCYSHKSPSPKSSPKPEDPWHSLFKHIGLCVFADKFNIPILNELAESNFYTEINRIKPSSWSDAFILTIMIGYAYNNLPSAHPILKFLAQYASWKLRLLRETAEFNQLVLVRPTFLQELLKHLNGLKAKPKAPYKKPGVQ